MHGRILRIAMLTLGLMAAGALAQPLDFRAKKYLADCQNDLARVEQVAQEMARKTEAMKVGDPTNSMQQIDALLSNRRLTDRPMSDIAGRIKVLPAGHPDVQALVARYTPVEQSLATSYKKLDEVKASLKGVVAQGQSPDYPGDLKRLQELATMFAPAAGRMGDPDACLDPARQRDAAMAERKRFGKKYAGLIHQSTPEGTTLAGTLDHFDKTLANYDEAAAKFVADAPQKIGGAIDAVLKDAEASAAQKKHLPFATDGGIPQRLSQLEGQSELLATIAPSAPASAEIKTRLQTARAKIEQIKTALAADIIAANVCPEDLYQGGDHAALLALVQSTWGEAGIQGQILKRGIHTPEWTRSVRWSWSNDRWYRIDTSRAQGFVVIKASDDLATVYHVNLVKDHMASDRLSAALFEDSKARPSITQMVPLAKVK